MSLAAQTLRLASIQINGSKRLPADQVAAASGLTIGEPVSLQDLQSAADRLSQLGLFEFVTYRYETTATTISVEFVVEETARFRPCEFDNFVWMPREEVLARLQEEIPLFIGEAPPGGFLTDEVQRVLAAILAERGIRARVVFFPTLSDTGGVNLFRIEGVPIPVASLRFPGAAQVDEEQLQRASQSLLARDYSQSFLRGFIQGTLLPLYRAKGFLRARFNAPQVAYLGEAEGTHPVVLTLPVEEGVPYRVREIRWSGNEVLSAGELQKRVSLRVGDVADTVRLEADLDRIRSEGYGERGHLLARLRIEPEFDDETRTAALTVRVEEGALYRFQALVLEGLPASAAAELQKRWKLAPGEPYNAVYVSSFIKDDVAAVLRRVSDRPVNIDSRLTRDDEHKTVILLLRFR